MRKGLDPMKAQAMLLFGQSSCGAEFHFPQEQANNVLRERERESRSEQEPPLLEQRHTPDT